MCGKGGAQHTMRSAFDGLHHLHGALELLLAPPATHMPCVIASPPPPPFSERLRLLPLPCCRHCTCHPHCHRHRHNYEYYSGAIVFGGSHCPPLLYPPVATAITDGSVLLLAALMPVLSALPSFSSVLRWPAVVLAGLPLGAAFVRRLRVVLRVWRLPRLQLRPVLRRVHQHRRALLPIIWRRACTLCCLMPTTRAHRLC